MTHNREYIEVDVAQFSPFYNRLCRMVSQYGTDSVVDYISHGSAGVRIERMKEGCFIDRPLATYELTWQQIGELAYAGNEYVQDNESGYTLVISGENMRRLAELRK